VDVVALSNLCVDVVVPVGELPPSDPALRQQLLADLTASPPPPSAWEVGGNTNFLIAASRIGLRAASAGHLGDDAYGRFTRDVLRAEGVARVVPVADAPGAPGSTLVCYVLVDGAGRHSFVSSYDFGPWPLLGDVPGVSAGCRALLEDTAAVWANGFVFDELPAGSVLGACEAARGAGAAVLFDPGPRVWTMQEGERRDALEAALRLSDVVLVTEEEGHAMTGVGDAEGIGRALLRRSGSGTEWVVVKRGADGATLVRRGEGGSLAVPGYAVPVADTVGCGDSFASAVALGYCRGLGELPTLALANAVGAATATGRGAGRQVATARRVLEILQTQGAGAEHQAARAVVREALGAAGESAGVPGGGSA